MSTDHDPPAEDAAAAVTTSAFLGAVTDISESDCEVDASRLST